LGFRDGVLVGTNGGRQRIGDIKNNFLLCMIYDMRGICHVKLALTCAA